MTIPAIIILTTTAINLLIAANAHGKERPRMNFWTVLVGNCIFLGLLYWGNFFAL